MVAHAAIVAFSLTLLVACSSDDDPDPGPTADQTTRPPTTTTTPATTTTAKPTPEQEVEAAYLKANAALASAFLASDPDDEELMSTRIDPSLSAIRDTLRSRQAEGLVAVYADGQTPVPEIISIEFETDDTASVRACLIDNGKLVRSSDGSVIDDQPTSLLSRTIMRRVDGAWKVASVLEVQKYDDLEGCRQ